MTRNREVLRNSFLLNSNSNKLDSDEKLNGVSDASSDSEEQQKQLREVNTLTKQMEQKETAINRLKFQLNELKTAAQESEIKRLEAEEQLEKLTKEKNDFDQSDDFKTQLR